MRAVAVRKCRVSSVLLGDTKMYGKRNMFDGNDESCWNSDKGVPQWVEMEFDGGECVIDRLEAMFQGGFVGTACSVYVQRAADSAAGGSSSSAQAQWVEITTLRFDDVNELQPRALPATRCSAMRLVFTASSDFFGRVTVYRLRVFAQE